MKIILGCFILFLLVAFGTIVTAATSYLAAHYLGLNNPVEHIIWLAATFAAYKGCALITATIFAYAREHS